MKRSKLRELVQQSKLEGRVRYGPERRALAELSAENRDDLDFQVHAARGTAAGLTAAIDDARPATRRIYDRAGESLAGVASDVGALGLSGLVAQIAARERSGATGRVAEERAGSLHDLQDRKVRAQEGRAFAVNNAVSNYESEQQKIHRQKLGLAGDEAAFRLGTLKGLIKDERQLTLEKRRIQIARQNALRQQRQTEADITGIDPRTGLPTADEQNRRRDDARADADKGKLSRGEVSHHQGIVESIQDAKAQAQQLHGSGNSWQQAARALTLTKTKDTPYGGYGPVVARAAVELARTGGISPGTMRALKARGFLTSKIPHGWRQSSGERRQQRARNRSGLSELLGL